MGNASSYSVPCRLVQGHTWSWTVSGLSSTYPFVEWSLAYHLVSANPAKSITLIAGNDGTNFTVAQTAAQTALLTPSDRLHGETGYHYQAVVTKTATGEKHVVARGTMDLEADLSVQLAGYDPRSPAQIEYDQLRMAFAEVSANRIASYTMADGRSVTYHPNDKADMLKRLNYLERLIELEARARELGCGLGNLKESKYQVRFV